MKLWFKKRTNSLKKLLVCLILFGFSFVAFTNPALAEFEGLDTQQTSSPTTQTTETTPLKPSPNTASPLTTESGEVLGCGILGGIPVVGDTCDTVADLASDLARLPEQIAGAIFSFITDNLLSLVQKIFFYVLNVIATVLGFPLALMFNVCGIPDKVKDIVNIVAYSPTDNQPLNVFVILDSGLAGVYQTLPETNPADNLAGIVKTNVLGIESAHAQGVGTSDLGEVIQSIWAKVRDAAIIFMAVILVVIGFMVMLRKRLDPRTVVTATNSLPKVVIALVLIVFSFAISGLFIDFIHLSIGVVRDYIGLTGVQAFISDKLGGELVWFPIFSALSFGTILDWTKILCLPGVGLMSAPLVFGLLMGILGLEIIFRLLLIIVGLYLFWILIKTYALMVLYTIFSPFFFLIGALPGFEGATVGWAKRMFVNALTFPAILALILIALRLISESNPINQVFSGVVKAPPPIDSSILNITYLLGVGIIFFATKVPKLLENIFKLEDFDIRGGIGPGFIFAPIGMASTASKGFSNIQGGIQSYTRMNLPGSTFLTSRFPTLIGARGGGAGTGGTTPPTTTGGPGGTPGGAGGGPTGGVGGGPGSGPAGGPTGGAPAGNAGVGLAGSGASGAASTGSTPPPGGGSSGSTTISSLENDTNTSGGLPRENRPGKQKS